MFVRGHVCLRVRMRMRTCVNFNLIRFLFIYFIYYFLLRNKLLFEKMFPTKVKQFLDLSDCLTIRHKFSKLVWFFLMNPPFELHILVTDIKMFLKYFYKIYFDSSIL